MTARIHFHFTAARRNQYSIRFPSGRRRLWFLLLFGIFGLAASSLAFLWDDSAATTLYSAGANGYRIELKSRVFTPDPGLEQNAREHFQKQLEKRQRVHAMVQLTTIPSSQERQALEAAGLRLLSYVGGSAWFAALSGAEPLDFTGGPSTARHPALRLIRWMGKITADDKTAPRLRARQIGDWARTADGKVLLVLSYQSYFGRRCPWKNSKAHGPWRNYIFARCRLH